MDEIITDPTRIRGLLDELHRRLLLIGVRLNPAGPLFDAALVHFDKTSARLHLGDLNCVDVKRQLTPGDEIEVFVSLRGVAVRFALTVEAIGYENGAPVCIAPYPQEIVYLQRRDTFRVQLPLYDRRSIRIRQRPSGPELTACILDLSIKGFCLELTVSQIDSSQIGTTFNFWQMDLPELRTPLAGEAALINVRESSRAGWVSAGFAILGLDPQTERHLMRAALYYQREARKKGV